VDPSGVYLKDGIDESMYFPRENGAFNLSEDGVLPYSTLSVEGINFTGQLHAGSQQGRPLLTQFLPTATIHLAVVILLLIHSLTIMAPLLDQCWQGALHHLTL